MDPKLLHHLYVVVNEGSMSDAALFLDVTQPTVTRSIKSIEKIVGEPVVKRGRYGVTPTEIGAKLVAHGRNIYSAMVSADDALSHWNARSAGEIRVGIGSMISTTVLPEFFATDPLRDTNITMRLVTATASTLVRQIRNGEIDLAVMPETKHQMNQSMIQIDLYTEQVCILAGSSSPLLESNATISAKQLAEQPWIALNPLTCEARIHDDVVKSLGIDSIIPTLSFDGDITAPIGLMRNSTMLAIMPRRVAQTYVTGGGVKILEVDIELPYRKYALWMAKENVRNANIKDMADKIITCFTRENINSKVANS